MTPKDIHYLMLIECVREGLPKNYVNDVLKHDLESLQRCYSGESDYLSLDEFYWQIRDSGSAILSTRDEHLAVTTNDWIAFHFKDGKFHKIPPKYKEIAK